MTARRALRLRACHAPACLAQADGAYAADAVTISIEPPWPTVS